MKKFKRLRRFYRQLRYYKVPQTSSSVTLHNYLAKPAKQDFWLREFIEARGLLANTKKKISIFSVFGTKLMMRLNRDDIKIFVARENVHREQWKDYAENCKDVRSIDLSLGFDYGDTDRYMRFPLWIMWLFPPDVDYAYIKKWCEQINHPTNVSYDNRKFCAFLCSHDDIGRREIYDQLSTIGRVDCDGKLFHNNDDLKSKYDDDKLRYLRNYRFNLCPENSSAKGYVTEKIFEAIASGCVPIYDGNEGCPPEPDILNSEAIMYIDMAGENQETLNKIQSLNINESAYMTFATQPHLKPDAAQHIWAYIEELEKRLRMLIEK
jgi:hypothetical protein